MNITLKQSVNTCHLKDFFEMFLGSVYGSLYLGFSLASSSKQLVASLAKPLASLGKLFSSVGLGCPNVVIWKQVALKSSVVYLIKAKSGFKRVSTWEQIMIRFWTFEENLRLGSDRVMILVTTLKIRVISSFLDYKVLVKHTSLRDSSLSSWAETRHSGTRFQCQFVKYNRAIESVIRFILMVVSSASFHERFDSSI